MYYVHNPCPDLERGTHEEIILALTLTTWAGVLHFLTKLKWRKSYFIPFLWCCNLVFGLYHYSGCMSGRKKPAKWAQRLLEIHLALHCPSEAGPSRHNVSWTMTIKRNEDKHGITITESKHTWEDSTLDPTLPVEDVSLVEPEIMAGDDFLPPSGSFKQQPSIGGNSEPLPQSEMKQKWKQKYENTAKVCGSH